MCLLAFIATNYKVNPEEFSEDGVFFMFDSFDDKKSAEIRPKMENKFIYEIGSFEGCACGFKYDETLFDDFQNEPQYSGIDYEEIKRQNNLKIRSIQKLINLIKIASAEFDVEFYACWFDELNMPIKEKIELNINLVDIRNNYFGLAERVKIRFKNQAVL